jgi:hypothetical protein
MGLFKPCSAASLYDLRFFVCMNKTAMHEGAHVTNKTRMPLEID